MILVFQHDLYHEGSLVTNGIKYVMRSDIMYYTNDDEEEESNQIIEQL